MYNIRALKLDKILISIDRLAALRRKAKGWPPIFTVIFVLLAFFIRSALVPVIGINVPFLLFPVAIVLSASIEGIWGGIIATLLSAALGHVFFLAPVGEIGYKGPVDIVTISIFALVGTSITMITEARNRVENMYTALLEKEHRARLEAITETKLRERFISVTSHELKTPLTNLKIYTQLLGKNPKNPKISEMLKKMESQVDNMTLFINDLVETSRVRAGKIQINRKRFDLNLLLSAIADNFTHTGRKIVIEGKLRRTVFADRARIGQVLNNLISNALKYSKKDVKISLLEDNDFAKIDVRDFGSGISKKDQQKIFLPFYRAKEIQAQQEGLGLGLYICSQIIKLHGGKIQAQSKPGKGSLFTVTLPFGIPRDTGEKSSSN